MSAVRGAVDQHHQAVADRRRSEREMGAMWRDAAARVVETRILEPLAIQDRDFATALTDLDQRLDLALSTLNP